MMFARNFFSHLCAFAERIDSLREVLEETIRTFRPATRDEKGREIARLYNVCYPFVIYEAPFLGETLERENIATFLVAVSDHIRRVSLVPNSAGRRG